MVQQRTGGFVKKRTALKLTAMLWCGQNDPPPKPLYTMNPNTDMMNIRNPREGSDTYPIVFTTLRGGVR